MEIQIVIGLGALAVLTHYAKAPLENLQNKMADLTARKYQKVIGHN